MLYSGSWDGIVRLWWCLDYSFLVNFGGVISVFFGGICVFVKCFIFNGLLFVGYDFGVI